MGGCQSKDALPESTTASTSRASPAAIAPTTTTKAVGNEEGSSPSRPTPSSGGSVGQEKRSSPARKRSITDGRATENGGVNHGGSKSNNPTSTSNGKAGGILISKAGPNTAALSDPQWKAIWKACDAALVDPADVHSVLSELQNNAINRLTSTEVTFIQRRIRTLVRQLPKTLTGAQNARASISRVFTNSSNKDVVNDKDQMGRVWVEKHHQLDEGIIRKLWAPGESLSSLGTDGSGGDVDILGSAFVILSHLSSEALWDRTAKIAALSARQVELVRDVNKMSTDDSKQRSKIQKTEIPAPPSMTQFAQAEADILGASLSSVCFLTALALRGSKRQKIQLLFYLLLPPKVMIAFLSSHPAGGLPTWLLEVGHDQVVSLASISHYYYFGTTFFPGKNEFRDSKDSNGIKKRAKALSVSASTVIETVPNILRGSSVPIRKRPVDQNGSSGSGMSAQNGSVTSGSNSGIERKGSAHRRRVEDERKDIGKNIMGITGDKTPVMEYLSDVREGKVMASPSRVLSHQDTEATVDTKWTMNEFFLWADGAMTDEDLTVLMHKVFGTGVLPSPWSERYVVGKEWQKWQEHDALAWMAEAREESVNADAGADYLRTASARRLQKSQNGSHPRGISPVATRIWGGVGGFDGRGGLGHGILYVIEKRWWDSWEVYSAWSWDNVQDETSEGKIQRRPKSLSNENLIDRSTGPLVAGTLGSVEPMKQEVSLGVDYVVLPSGVWDVLFELYGGGPPLPRMVLPPQPRANHRHRTLSSDSKQMEIEDEISLDGSVELTYKSIMKKPLRVPQQMLVVTHPWVIHCHLCDAGQPYRRGDVGPMSIRLMSTPNQPLERLFAEMVVRLKVQNAAAIGPNGRGKARLWKRMDTTSAKEPASRFGPWTLLCKSRAAIFPIQNQGAEFEKNYAELTADWQAYADHQTVEGIGMANGDRLMLEYAVQNKGEFVWPRELAAKAGRVKRLAEEDKKFRLLLRGVDEKGELMKVPPKLIGMNVDAEDSNGRWYQVEIKKTERAKVEEVEDEDGEEDDEEMKIDKPSTQEASVKKVAEFKQVQVDFSDFGGNSEWIEVDSDRLAVAGRFSVGKADKSSQSPSKSQENGKKQITAAGKKISSDMEVPGKLCTLPGYGACGLANLGNTCYANSAIQCISYLPLLRSYLISSQYKASGDLNKDNPLGTGGKLLEEFASLIRVMWSGKHGELTPRSFRKHLGNQRSQFAANDQQDAQELLSYLLDVLHEDSNKVKKKPYVEALEDSWVKDTDLPRVGEEAWRRYLRRNRSIMADVSMGQLLNTVQCTVCGFSSRNFDPINLLSIPFPTVADVIFQCTLIRRANVVNCSKTLNRTKKGEKAKNRFDTDSTGSRSPPSDHHVTEQYVIAMSRLADIGDLRLRLQNLCSIPASRLRLFKAEEMVVNKELNESEPTRTYTRITALPDKEGPCIQLAKKPNISSADEVGASLPAPTQIVAFEYTIRPRVKEDPKKEELDAEESDTVEDEEESKDDSKTQLQKEMTKVKELLVVYGDSQECRVYDTDPLPISKCISRCLWPKTASEFKLGLRVDAIDHKEHWFPGSVVEIMEGVQADGGGKEKNGSKTTTKVRIHFDNFSSKWDEIYTIEDFKQRKVRPLYSHANPRKPTEFVVYHRCSDATKETNQLFGQPFHLQCQNEWSTARACAHLLAQASRFLQKSSEESDGENSKAQKVFSKCQASISDLIDLLLDSDRAYVQEALSKATDYTEQDDRNPTFDATTLSTNLVKKVAAMLHRLPFEMRVCTAETLSGNKKGTASPEEVPFPVSLIRTIGNYMNARHALVLHWKEPPVEKKSSKPIPLISSPVMYLRPKLVIHKSSSILEEESKKSKNSPGSGGLHLGVCLTEFCKENKLDLDDNWRCPRCKDYREGKQHMNIWRLPDLLTFHIKRFNCSARWREKIMTKVNFPLTGLDMTQWCHPESPALGEEADGQVYDLIGVMNHYGGMTGGHYVAVCKATACSPDGTEEVAYDFNGVPTLSSMYKEEDVAIDGSSHNSSSSASGGVFRSLGRKDRESKNEHKEKAANAARNVAESAEPLWLQFDDDLVEPIPPRNVVSEMAYVLFYRRRRMTPSNVAKYSALD